MNPDHSSKSLGIAAFALHHSKALVIFIVGLCMWGLLSLFTLPSGIYPDVAFPRIAAIAERGEDSVDNMMIGVTRPLEEVLNAVPGLVRIRSKTIRGGSEISLDFAPKTDMRDALSQTRARVAALLPQLPSGLDTTIEQQSPSVFPVISFNVSLNPQKASGKIRDGADLDQWAKNDLKPRLSRLPDVFQVSIQGSESRQIIVEPDPRKLASSSLSLEDLVSAIKESNEVQAVGMLEKDYKQFQVLASHELHGANDIAALAVVTRSGKPVHLRDVAKVYTGMADRTSIITGNGADAVVVSLFMRYGGKITALSDHVSETIRQITPTLPPGVSITPVYDQANLVRESLGGVRDAILVGMLLSVIILWIFLGSWRLTLIAGITIPISVLCTFSVMSAMGQSLNLMSLGGIAVAIGFIIDNAIVVVENIARHIGLSPNKRLSVINATRQIMGAVAGSSLTTIVVFAPLVLLEGIVGQFFRAMAVTLTIGIIVSVLVALMLTPVISAGAMGPRAGEKTSRAWMDKVSSIYESMIRRCLRRPWISSLLILGAAVVGFLFCFGQSTGFLPAMDEGGFVLDYRMPVGTSLSETDRNCRKVEAVLSQIPEVVSFSRRTGAELGFFATEQFTGDMLVALKPKHARNRSTNEVIDEIRKRVAMEVPQIEVGFVQIMQDTINDLAGNASPLEVKLFGNDYRIIQGLSTLARNEMEKVPGIVDISSGASYGSPEITYQLDPNAISRIGLASSDFEGQIHTALLGEEATQLRRANYMVPVFVRYADFIRHDPAWLAQLPLVTKEGKLVPVSLVSRMKQETNVNELNRENQQPLVSVEASISDRDLGTVARELRPKLAKIPLSGGVRLELGGQIQSQATAFRNLMVVLAIAVSLVFLLLVIQFRSYRLPLIIFLAMPFSQIGALWALRLTGTELNISAFMGLIMLIGLVVRNGIILIEYTAQLRVEGMDSLFEALATAGRVRLRPVLMTSLTAIMALLPLALNMGSGAELQRPLAIAVIGGLCLSTLLTLFVIPVAHILIGETKHLVLPQAQEGQ